jgi:hypothetical protein
MQAFSKINMIQRADIKSKSFRACCNNRTKHPVGKLDTAKNTNERKHPRRIKKLK